MLNIALLNKAETCAIGLASNALHLIFFFVTTPIFLYKEWPLFLFSYFADHIKVHYLSSDIISSAEV